MKRLILIIALVGLVIVATGAGGSSSSGGDRYRVAAIFDTAKGMDPTQLVKIAGARVGTVEDVQLVDGPKARLILDIEPEYGPFGDDATCRILPEGLISEYFVQCDPGDPSDGPLRETEDGMPTVPVTRTQVPVSLQQVLDVFSQPVDQRIRLFVNELGLATAGRGQDLNALIRRANPALEQSRHVLAVINGQRAQLTNAVVQTDKVLARLAAGEQDIRRFVGRTTDVVSTTADHRESLSAAISRLPALLDEVEPSMRALDEAMAAGTPLLAALDQSAPPLETLNRTLPDFAEKAVPALQALGEAADTGRDMLPALRPVVADLKRTTDAAVPFAQHFDDFLVHFRDNGGSENAIDTFYSLAAIASGYDGVSHIVSIIAHLFPRCFTNAKAPGCSHAYSAEGMGRIPVNTADRSPFRKRAKDRPAPTPGSTAPPASTAPAPSATATPAPAKRPPVKLPLDISKLVPGLDLAPLAELLNGRPGGQPAPDTLRPLLDYLLK